MDSVIKDTCDTWAAEARVPAGLADRALRGRTLRRTFKVALTAGSTALVAAAGLAIAFGAAPTAKPRPQPSIQPIVLSPDTSLRTDLSNSFPRHLVAAGHTAVAAYYTSRTQGSTLTHTWNLYDPASGTYQTTSWAYLDVAPGMHQAAVLEGPLPASRIGVLDMATQKVVRWISVGHQVAAVSWAPDGRRLVATAYRGNPDAARSEPGACSRTGYSVVDTATGSAVFHTLVADRNDPGSRQDLGWSRNGTLLWAPTATVPTKVFYDLSGHQRPAPPHEADANTPEEAGLSPNGTLLPHFGPRPGPAITVVNVTTGKTAAVLPIEQALVWADDDDLFALGCAAKACMGKGEFHNRLLLVGLNGKITPLTGYQRSDRPGAWTPVFTHR
jgi:hypothetical protein